MSPVSEPKMLTGFVEKSASPIEKRREEVSTDIESEASKAVPEALSSAPPPLSPPPTEPDPEQEPEPDFDPPAWPSSKYLAAIKPAVTSKGTRMNLTKLRVHLTNTNRPRPSQTAYAASRSAFAGILKANKDLAARRSKTTSTYRDACHAARRARVTSPVDSDRRWITYQLSPLCCSTDNEGVFSRVSGDERRYLVGGEVRRGRSLRALPSMWRGKKRRVNWEGGVRLMKKVVKRRCLLRYRELAGEVEGEEVEEKMEREQQGNEEGEALLD